jgi:hypothetical protein
MRVVTAFVAMVLFCGALAGSALAQRKQLAPPRVTVESLEPLNSGAGQPRFRVSLLIDNPNTEPLGIRGIEFKLRIANEGIIDGGLNSPFRVEALDRQSMTLDVGSDIISSLSRLMSFVEGPENMLPYEMYGTVTIDRRLRDPFRFSERGQVPLVLPDQR